MQNIKKQKTRKNTTNPRSSHPYTQRQLPLERKTQDDLSSSQITYPEYFCQVRISFQGKRGHAFLARLGRSEIIIHTDYPHNVVPQNHPVHQPKKWLIKETS